MCDWGSIGEDEAEGELKLLSVKREGNPRVFLSFPYSY